jgi:hypothetical protein
MVEYHQVQGVEVKPQYKQTNKQTQSQENRKDVELEPLLCFISSITQFRNRVY